VFIVIEFLADLCEVVEYLYEGWVVVFFLAKLFQKILFSWWCRNLFKKTTGIHIQLIHPKMECSPLVGSGNMYVCIDRKSVV
jgi:hypothetical protein